MPPTTNVLLGLGSSSIKTSGDETGWSRTNAVDGDESHNSHWSGTPLASGVDDMWFAVDTLSGSHPGGEIDAYRYLTDAANSDTPQNVATEIRLYSTNDDAKWAALTHGSGKMTDDPVADLGWTLRATNTGPLAAVRDTGRVSFIGSADRYWLFKAIAGGTSEWDVNEFELWANYQTGTSPKAARCDHNHRVEHLNTNETDTSLTLHPDGSGALELRREQADEIDYDNASSGLTADDVQAAIDELDSAVDGLSSGASETWADVMGDLSASLVHRWEFADASGNFADSIGSLALAVTGSPTYHQGAPLGAQSAVLFASGTNGLAATIGSVPTGANDRTLVCIYKTNGDISTNASVFGYGTSGTTRQWFSHKINDSTAYSDSLAVWSDDLIVAQRGSADGRWHMVAIGCSGGGDSIYLYIDGAMFARRVAAALNTGTTVKMKVPYDTGYGLYVDDLSVFTTWLGRPALDRLWRSIEAAL